MLVNVAWKINRLYSHRRKEWKRQRKASVTAEISNERSNKYWTVLEQYDWYLHSRTWNQDSEIDLNISSVNSFKDTLVLLNTQRDSLFKQLVVYRDREREREKRTHKFFRFIGTLFVMNGHHILYSMAVICWFCRQPRSRAHFFTQRQQRWKVLRIMWDYALW